MNRVYVTIHLRIAHHDEATRDGSQGLDGFHVIGENQKKGGRGLRWGVRYAGS